MFLKNTLTLFLVFSFLLPQAAKAQSFQRIIHTAGTQSVAGVDVTVIPKNGACVYNGCNTGPYYIGCSGVSNGYLYKFKSAVTPVVNVTNVRVHLTNVNNGELISFYVNGVFFPISQSDLSVYNGTCILPVSDAIGGKVGSFQSNSAAIVDIKSTTPIDSIYVLHENGLYSGTHYTFEFQSDPRVSLVVPLTDSVLCLGDTINVPYYTTTAFNGDNAFNVELSNARGNFDNPVVIGTTYSSSSGHVSAIIPSTTPRGTGYRIRIRSTSPALITSDNGKDLGIYPFPTVDAGSNSPICIGDALKLFSTADDGSTFSWQGPNAFTSNKQNPTINPMTAEYGGVFTVSANLFGCVTKDTVKVSIKPTPDVTDATNNGPICEGETLVISAKTSFPGAILTWTGPALSKQEGSTITISPAKASNKGTYEVYATLDGCKSEPISTDANVKPLPVKPYAQNNGPLRVGDEIKLSGGSATPNATYSWTGPDGFTATQADTSAGAAYDRPDNNYTLTVTIDGCSLSVTTTVAVIPEQLQQIYPNPTDGILNIKLNLAKNDSKKIPISIINHAGQVVQYEEGEAKFGAMRKTITLHEGLIPGMYLLRMAIDKKTTDIKFFYNGK